MGRLGSQDEAFDKSSDNNYVQILYLYTRSRFVKQLYFLTVDSQK